MIETRRTEAAAPFPGRVRRPCAVTGSDPATIAAAVIEGDAVTTDALAQGKTVSATAEAALSLHRAEWVWASFSYIESWYNPARLHSGLGYRSTDDLRSLMGGGPDRAVALKPTNCPRKRGNLS